MDGLGGDSAMEEVKRGGLAGKARRSRKKNRAARLRTHQLIMDYLDSEPVSGSEPVDRVIPIRRNRNALSLSPPSFQHFALASEPRSDIPLDESKPVREEEACRITARSDRSDSPNLSAHTNTAAPVSVPATDSGSLRLVAPDAEPRARFTIRGFVYGCALGAAAAAVCLLVLQATVG
jgi:hypothetical protein